MRGKSNVALTFFCNFAGRFGAKLAYLSYFASVGSHSDVCDNLFAEVVATVG